MRHNFVRFVINKRVICVANSCYFFLGDNLVVSTLVYCKIAHNWQLLKITGMMEKCGCIAYFKTRANNNYDKHFIFLIIK